MISLKVKKSYQTKFFWILGFEIIRAKEAEKILGSSKHIDKGFIYNFVHPFLKTGLLTSKGEKWLKRRRMLTPAFHFDILKEFFEVFKEESDKLIVLLRDGSKKGFNIIPISSQFTLNTICGKTENKTVYSIHFQSDFRVCNGCENRGFRRRWD